MSYSRLPCFPSFRYGLAPRATGLIAGWSDAEQAGGSVEASAPLGNCSGKCPFFMTKQLTVDEAIRDCSTVNHDKGSILSW